MSSGQTTEKHIWALWAIKYGLLITKWAYHFLINWAWNSLSRLNKEKVLNLKLYNALMLIKPNCIAMIFKKKKREFAIWSFSSRVTFYKGKDFIRTCITFIKSKTTTKGMFMFFFKESASVRFKLNTILDQYCYSRYKIKGFFPMQKICFISKCSRKIWKQYKSICLHI